MPHELNHADQRAVLVVEDSHDDFDTVVQAALRARVHNRLVQAVDADVALRLLAAEPGSFAFMLLDFNVPGVDGLALLQQMRRDPALLRLPVVVFTTSVNPRDRDAFYDAGANAYHVKTVRYEDCLFALEGIFHYWLTCATLPGPVSADAAALPRP
jgi:CheY-like chemotaxis protein